MPLLMEPSDAGVVPVVCCDHCGERILAAADGTLHWVTGPEAQRVPVHFIHRSCRRAFERQRGGEWEAVELAQLPALVAAVFARSGKRHWWSSPGEP